MGDRVASLTMLIQVCPVLGTGHIKSLLNMASRFGRGDVAMAVDALKDLFVGTLLPDRKLRSLSQMEPCSEKRLGTAAFLERCVVAYFEDYLKLTFAAFVQLLAEASHSAVGFFKIKAIRVATELLTAKPEQERALLGMLVNKLGDLTSKVSSLGLLSLKKVEETHPMMKGVIAREIEAYLMRPNIATKAQYHALLHLTEMVLSRRPEDAKLAAQLIKIYVAQLQKALAPSSQSGTATSSSAAGKHKLRRKRQQHIQKRRGHLVEDDNRLVRTLINGIQRALPYLEAGLVTKQPLEAETLDALFKVCHTVSAFSTRIAILSLLYRCLLSKGDPPDRFYRLLYEQTAQFDFWSCTHRLKALSLLRRCVPADASLTRGVAVARRMLQVGANGEAALGAASLEVLRELLMAHRAEMKQLLSATDKELKAPADAEADVEEVFHDDDRSEDGAEAGKRGGVADSERYEPLAREPRFARARHTPLWELHALRQHVHPFVAHGASKLLSHENFQDAGSNPFEDHSCNELLEQFAYVSRARRPKTGAKANSKGQEAADKLLYNSERFVKKKRVLPHERFFQAYFRDSVVRSQQLRKAKARSKREEDIDEERAGMDDDADAPGFDEEEDEFFDEYLKGQIPKGEGGDDDDEDEDPDMDDDSAFDSEGEGAESSAGSGGASDADGASDASVAGSAVEQPSDGDDDDDDDEEDDEDDEEDDAPQRGKKRKASAEPASRKDKIKALKKKHSGSMFASVEDFEQLLADDDAA
eukprot:TRINITY_DN21632_c0_g1_i1.p1 TRINITY_DN21632_c0_g1~~TRINITY_DN21632_c0_g1_i1.p1  ORF type:complete len:854 (-),score=254.54 TRINITY_DN21632_c0_g1_i1:103-2379(-)